MGIVKYEPTVVINEPLLPTIEPINYHSIVTDDNQKPIRSLLAYVEGAPWSVNYYSQVLSKDNDLKEVDTGQSNVYQQYHKINKLELRVSSALSDSYDQDTSITSVVGNGFIYAGLVPNINDYFVSDVNDNRTGIFRITGVERKSFNRDSVYYIEYTLVGFEEVEPGTSIYNELNSKSIRTYYFSRDRLIENLQPLIREEDQQQIINLNELYNIIINSYFNTFYSKKQATIIIPGQEFNIYDNYLVDYLLKIIDSQDHLNVKYVRQLPTDNVFFNNQSQFWNIMFNRLSNEILTCNKQMSLVNRYILNSDTYVQGLYFSTIDYFIYPTTIDLSYITGVSNELVRSDITIQETKSINNVLSSEYVKIFTEASVNYNYIYPVLHDDYYVLSENFYNNTSEQSLLEILVKDYINHNTINISRLLLLCNDYPSWGRLEQYYYGPILLTLIKESNRNIYS